MDFDVRMRGEPIYLVPLSESVRTGITFDGGVPGCVPMFEEHDTRREAGYTLAQWRALTHQERALEVAYTRMKRYIDLHVQDVVQRDAKRKAKRNRK